MKITETFTSTITRKTTTLIIRADEIEAWITTKIKERYPDYSIKEYSEEVTSGCLNEIRVIIEKVTDEDEN
jgi:hypothetical protein